jgi:hypothetical protein
MLLSGSILNLRAAILISTRSRGAFYGPPYDGFLPIGVMMIEATKGLPRSRSALRLGSKWAVANWHGSHYACDFRRDA